MLAELRRIIQQVSSVSSLPEALALIVKGVRETVDVEVCSIYLSDHENQLHILMATQGLDVSQVDALSLPFGEGLVGLVAQREEPINLNNATKHSNFHFFPEVGEEKFNAFLGVPIIHQRRVLGVLVVQQEASRKFAEEEETFLITLSAQLAGVIAHAEMMGLFQADISNKGVKRISGLPGSPGIAVGHAVVLSPAADLDKVPDRSCDDVKQEISLLRLALKNTRNEIKKLKKELQGLLPKQELALFDAYERILRADSLGNEIEEIIKTGQWAQGALRQVVSGHMRVFSDMEDEYIRERASDLKDLGQRVLAQLQASGQAKPKLHRQTILVADEVSAAALVELPLKKIAGLVSIKGSSTSHTAILAKALGLPAIMGIGDVPINQFEGQELIIDGYNGSLYLAPDRNLKKEYLQLANEEKQLSKDLSLLRKKPSVTLDGKTVPLFINSGLSEGMEHPMDKGIEGIGLYRTEIPFMTRERFPSEETQTEIYRRILKVYKHKTVTMRTLDVGGDKSLSYFPIQEDNPFLGWRGIRITLDHPEIFLVQVRALLRANQGINNLKIALPMISTMDEVDESLRLIKQAYNELLEEQIDPDSLIMPSIGLVLEVPSAVYQARAMAKKVDFISIGSNDLTQYLLAVDRNNPRVANYYSYFHPAVLNAIMQAITATKKENKAIYICGEMAGDPAAAILLLAMEFDGISMNVQSLGRVKQVIRSFDFKDAKRLLKKALKFESANEIRQLLWQALEAKGLGGLIRAGK